MPGRVTRDAFLQQIQFTPYLGYATDYGDDIAMMFELTATESLRLADVIRVYGPPDHVGCFANDLTLHARQHPLTVVVSLYFAHGLIEVTATRSDTHPYLSPDMDIRSIRYYAPGEPAYPIGSTTKWRGFAAAPSYLMCYVP